ncbi:MAG TPA: DUF1800 domain-containing protein [Gemmatimonadota bacterium]|jgi:uncharacterized protein (DUF1800 family)
MKARSSTRGALVGAILIAGWTAPGAGQTAVSSVSAVAPADDERGRVVHLLQRATYGPRPEDIAAALASGPHAWLEEQLHPDRIDDSALALRLEPLDAVTMSLEELYEAYPSPRRTRAAMGDVDSIERRRRMREMREEGFESSRRIGAELAAARLQRAVYSERQLEAVMTDFWFNRFNVYWGKGMNRWLVPDYEREAIRPHVFGRFEDMLLATARHPAMLFYLDNWRSIAPDSLRPDGVARAARDVPEGAGFNENYARELLELHTLGVDGGYTQADVIAAARALTGWSIALDGDVPEFRFRPALHDVGEKRFLGHELPAGRGMEDGEDVLAILARHPSTARHVARDLVEAFVADEPPPALVDRLTNVFLETDGDLREVTRALFTAPEFEAMAVRGIKVKSPFELVASALRLTDAEAAAYNAAGQYLRSAGEEPYGAREPIGYPETAEAWIDGGAMLQRMNLALALASGAARGIEIDAGELTRDSAADGMVDALVARLLPGGETARVAGLVTADLARPGTEGASPAEPAERALGLILGSPEFQRR